MTFPPAKYVEHKSAIDAIVSYLWEIGKPASAEQIATAISAGGWRGGGTAARSKVLQSIGQLTRARFALRAKIKVVNGLVGPADWDDTQFGVQRTGKVVTGPAPRRESPNEQGVE